MEVARLRLAMMRAVVSTSAAGRDDDFSNLALGVPSHAPDWISPVPGTPLRRTSPWCWGAVGAATDLLVAQQTCIASDASYCNCRDDHGVILLLSAAQRPREGAAGYRVGQPEVGRV